MTITFNGFIKDNSNFYLFYNHLHPIQNKTYNLTDDIIWGTIHVIVNQQKILATPSWQPITPPIPPHIPRISDQVTRGHIQETGLSGTKWITGAHSTPI